MKKIDVAFYKTDYYDGFDRLIPVTKITPAQLTQLQENIAKARHPEKSCTTGMTVTYTDRMSFLKGGKRCDHITGRIHILKITDLFWLSDGNVACGACLHKDEIAIMRHCARKLRAGKCRDEFMRNTIGTVLFPQFYAKDKQK